MVRTEEFVNAFDYGYQNPEDTFGITLDAAPLPYGCLLYTSRCV